MKTSVHRSSRGFTLIELLLVIGIIAILASIVIVAINPTKQLGVARDAQRRADVNTILNAIYQFAIDNNGAFPGNLSGATLTNAITYNICKVRTCPTYSALGSFTYALTGSYLSAMPQDPALVGTATGYTGYTVRKEATGRITISAPRVETAGQTISVSR